MIVAVAPAPTFKAARCCVEPKLVVLLALTVRLRAASLPALVLTLSRARETLSSAPGPCVWAPVIIERALAPTS